MEHFDRIPFADLSPETSWSRLGKGSFGCVYKGEYLGLEVAIKEVMESGEYDVDKYFQRECKIMQEARHPNIVQYLGLCLAPPAPGTPSTTKTASRRKRILIISEYLPRGNLRSYIHHVHLPFPWRLRLSFAIDVTRAVAYLHARQCLHRDLKGENLLVTENERLKVCDFGFSRIAAQNDEEMRRMSYCGTDGYMSPEILMGEEFGLPTDVYSLGVIFVEILTRRLVDGDTFKREMPSFSISPSEIRSLASPHCPPSLIALTLSCLSINPSDRPPVLAILHSLRSIEVEVLAMEARGIGLSPADGGVGTWNVGSISFAGTTKRGKRSAAPGLPDFGAGSTRRDSGGSEGSEDLEVAMLALAEVKVGGHGRRRRGESEKGLLEEEEYSTSVVRKESGYASSTLTVRGFKNTHDRLASSASSLPSLPSSWIRQPPAEDSSSSDDSLPRTPNLLDETEPRSTDSKLDSRISFMTARTDAISIAGATINHGGSEYADEAEDVFHSTFLAQPAVPLHRFSLIKPGFQRFLGSLAPYNNPSVVDLGKKTGGEVGKRVAERKEAKTKCGLCEKKLGIMKAFLECDDCQFRCHLKCSDMCPPGCGEPLIDESLLEPTPPIPTRPLPAAPSSKLLKKRLGSTSPKGRAST